MKALWLVPLLLLSACTRDVTESRGNTPVNEPLPKEPARKPERPDSAPYADEFKIWQRVQLVSLDTYWKQSAAEPAVLAKEPVLAVCIDKDGHLSSRATGEEWKQHTRDDSLLELLRRFAEESIDADSMVSYCQVVVGIDESAGVKALLGLQEMLVQARIRCLYLETWDIRRKSCLLDLSMPVEKEESAARLILVRDAEGMTAKYSFNSTTKQTRGPSWNSELADFVKRQSAIPEVLLISGGDLPMSTMADALNAMACLGVKRVRFVP